MVHQVGPPRIIEATTHVHGCVPQVRRKNGYLNSQEQRQTVFGLRNCRVNVLILTLLALAV
jgi:hypothetical protein